MSNADPVLERTWQFVNNVILTGATTQAGGADDGPEWRKNMLLHIKDTFIGFATLPWTVAGSASFDTGVGAMDAVDRWGGIIDLRWVDSTGANRSWIVLENAALGIQFLIDCVTFNNGDGSTFDGLIAPTSDPFVGGSINARPTSPSETLILDRTITTARGGWGTGTDNNVAKVMVFHIQHSEDGKGTRVVMLLDGLPIGFWLFDEMVRTIGTPNNLWVARVEGADTADTAPAMDFTALHSNARTFALRDDGVRIEYYLAMPSNNQDSATLATQITTQSPYDGRITTLPVGCASEDGGWVGFFGELADMYFETVPGFTGRGYPASTREWVQFGILVLPWDGSVPVVA